MNITIHIDNVTIQEGAPEAFGLDIDQPQEEMMTVEEIVKLITAEVKKQIDKTFKDIVPQMGTDYMQPLKKKTEDYQQKDQQTDGRTYREKTCLCGCEKKFIPTGPSSKYHPECAKRIHLEKAEEGNKRCRAKAGCKTKGPGGMTGLAAKKICIDCGAEFQPTGNAQKRCPECKAKLLETPFEFNDKENESIPPIEESLQEIKEREQKPYEFGK